MARAGRRQRGLAGSPGWIGIAASGARRSRRAFGAAVFLISAGVAFAAMAAAAVDDELGSPFASTGRWRVLDELPSRGETLTALALAEAAGAGLAVGDAAGVSWWRDGRWSRAQTPPVRDLAFDRDGRLWIGSEEGLQFWAHDARPQRRTLRDGESSNRVSRIEASRGALVVATEGGAYWSSSGAVFQSLGSGSADQSVAWVAVRRAVFSQAGESAAGRPGQELVEVWSFGGEGLVRVRGIEATAGLRVLDRIVWPLPRPAAEAGVVDLVFDREGERLHVVYPDAIAVLAVEGSDPRDFRWQWVRPVVSPGAVIRRLVFGAARDVWLTTDHGLLAANALTSSFRRTGNPAGSRECSDLVEANDLPGGARADRALSHEPARARRRPGGARGRRRAGRDRRAGARRRRPGGRRSRTRGLARADHPRGRSAGGGDPQPCPRAGRALGRAGGHALAGASQEGVLALARAARRLRRRSGPRVESRPDLRVGRYAGSARSRSRRGAPLRRRGHLRLGARRDRLSRRLGRPVSRAATGDESARRRLRRDPPALFRAPADSSAPRDGGARWRPRKLPSSCCAPRSSTRASTPGPAAGSAPGVRRTKRRRRNPIHPGRSDRSID